MSEVVSTQSGFPPCPQCKDGHMVPLSTKDSPHAEWHCTNPACDNSIAS